MKREKQCKVHFLSWMKYFPEKNDSSKKTSSFDVVGKNLIILTLIEIITINSIIAEKDGILRKNIH